MDANTEWIKHFMYSDLIMIYSYVFNIISSNLRSWWHQMTFRRNGNCLQTGDSPSIKMNSTTKWRNAWLMKVSHKLHDISDSGFQNICVPCLKLILNLIFVFYLLKCLFSCCHGTLICYFSFEDGICCSSPSRSLSTSWPGIGPWHEKLQINVPWLHRKKTL